MSSVMWKMCEIVRLMTERALRASVAVEWKKGEVENWSTNKSIPLKI